MKSITPAILGTAAMLAAVATAILNANGRFIGRTYLVPWFYAGCFVLLVLAIVVGYESRRVGKPLVIPLRYGPYSATTRTSVINGNLGHHGLIVANHGEPAYHVSVSPSTIPIGTSELRFQGSKPVFTKADGDAFFIGTIEVAPQCGESLSDGFVETLSGDLNRVGHALHVLDRHSAGSHHLQRIFAFVSLC
jgi:hypothetical protein